MEANANGVIERAKKQFETHGVEWNDRTEAAVRNVVAPLLMDRDAAVLTPAQVRVIRALVSGAIGDHDRCLQLFNAFHGTQATVPSVVREGLEQILDQLAGYYSTEGVPY